jgi:hypothetical protein
VWGFFVGLQDVSEKHEVEKRRPRRSEEIIKRLVSEFGASGVEASKFCRNHRLARSVLYRHLPRGGLGKMEPKPSARLVPVSLVGAEDSEQPGSGCALELVLRNGRRIEVRPHFDSDTLERLLKILEGV